MLLHPFVTHFPIVLVIAIIVTEICLLKDKEEIRSYEKLATIFSFLLFVSVTASFFTGLSAADSANQSFVVPDSAIAQHYQLGRITFFLGLCVGGAGMVSFRIVHEDALLRTAYRVSLFCLLILSIVTGYHGGVLVFKHGAGVLLESSVPDQELQRRPDLPL